MLEPFRTHHKCCLWQHTQFAFKVSLPPVGYPPSNLKCTFFVSILNLLVRDMRFVGNWVHCVCLSFTFTRLRHFTERNRTEHCLQNPLSPQMKRFLNPSLAIYGLHSSTTALPTFCFAGCYSSARFASKKAGKESTRKDPKGPKSERTSPKTSPKPVVPEASPSTTKTTATHAASSITGPTIDMSDKKAEVVFSFDTTGSMYTCLTQVRRDISNCVDRLFSEIGTDNLRIGITAHGDYCDEHTSYVTKHLPLTNKKADIVDFVHNCGNTGGGDAAECYELVLHEAAKDYAWTKGWNKALVMIGDDLPHEPSYPLNKKKINWRTECDNLAMMGIQVHGVQALSRKHADKFYAEISSKTNGVHVPLEQFNSITDLVCAVCYREARPSVLEKFEREVQAGGRYSRAMQHTFDKMLGRTRGAGDGALAGASLNAVPPGRFQVLKVDKDCSIKEFVQAQGVTFKVGRGFYEFTKPEVIQDRKEIVLMDPKTGDMFEGDYARTLINAPRGGSGNRRVAPAEIDFIPFIQSTSATRKLIAGTRFLYEIAEGY